MSPVLLAVCLVSMVSLAQAKPPTGYILQLTPECGASNKAVAAIKLITDLNADAKAKCDGADANFTSTDGVNYALEVSYPGGTKKPCMFMKRKDADVYFVTVTIAYGEVGSLVHQTEEEFTVTCTFAKKGDDDTGDQSIAEGLIAPTERANNMGMSSTSKFTLELCDVLGAPLNASNVAMGRTVQLMGKSSGADSELGIRPVSCYAIDGSAKYAILRAGCGDGVVFDKDEGFTTNGTVTLSPYFKAFSINQGAIVKFECTFVICTGKKCDGSSCVVVV